MRILDTPPEMRRPPHRFPRHNFGLGMEQYCHLYLKEHAEEIKSDYIYLPIYWINNYYYQSHYQHEKGFHAVQEVEEYLAANLNHQERYVTVCVCPEGIYEQLPECKLTVLGAAGAGDVPLPLLCAEHPKRRDVKQDLTASFLGAKDCGGAGTAVRREMFRTFPQFTGDFYLEDHQSGGSFATDIFCSLIYRSRFALAPRGYGKTSFRLYEAMQIGTPPVYIYDEPWLPYADKLDWNSFCVLATPEDLPTLPYKLRDILDLWRTNAVSLLETLVPEFFSFPGVARQLKPIIEGLE